MVRIRAKEGKREKILTCLLDPQLAVIEESAINARHGKSGLSALAFPQDLGLSLAKTPQAHPILKPLHTLLSYTISVTSCFPKFLSHYRCICYTIYSLFSRQLFHSQAHSSLSYSHPFYVAIPSHGNIIYHFGHSFTNIILSSFILSSIIALGLFICIAIILDLPLSPSTP